MSATQLQIELTNNTGTAAIPLIPLDPNQLDFIDRLRARHDNVLSRDEMATVIIQAGLQWDDDQHQ